MGTFLWAAGSAKDGGSVVTALQQGAEEIERRLGASLKDMGLTGLESASLWTQVVLNFYGPRATEQLAGKKVMLEFGKKIGAASMNGSPAYTARLGPRLRLRSAPAAHGRAGVPSNVRI